MKWDNSRVAEGPAEIAFCEGKQRVVASSQGYPVDVGPRLGTVTGMEMIRHAVGTVDPGRVTKAVSLKGDLYSGPKTQKF